MSNNQLDQQQVAQLQAMLQNPALREAVGIKFAPRARIGVSEKQNLILSEKKMNGAVGKNADGTMYYMAGIRGRGDFRSTPFPCNVTATKEGIAIQIHFAFDNDYERTLYTQWVQGTAQPTFISAKTKASQNAPTTPASALIQSATPAPIASAPIAPAPVASTPAPVSQAVGVQLNALQRMTLKKVLEIGAYKDENEAMSRIAEWGQMKPKDFE